MTSGYQIIDLSSFSITMDGVTRTFTSRDVVEKLFNDKFVLLSINIGNGVINAPASVTASTDSVSAVGITATTDNPIAFIILILEAEAGSNSFSATVKIKE